MATITAVEKQKRRRRFDVHLDGTYAFSVIPDLIVERHLTVGATLTDADRREIEAEDQRRGAIMAALSLVAMQARSEKDLRDRLHRRGFTAEAVNLAVTRLRELGYLNDAAYARLFVEARQAATPRSRRALSFELGHKGIDRELVASAVEELSDADAAYDAAQRRLRSLRGLDRTTFTRRLGSFLASRGFGYAIARATVDRCFREMSEVEA